MIACCGIDCDVCDIRRAKDNPEIAEKMVNIFVNMGYKDAKPEWFRCEGCFGNRDAHWSADCRILACCVDEKHLENCGQCPEFMCELIDNFANDGFEHHKKAVERLKHIFADGVQR